MTVTLATHAHPVITCTVSGVSADHLRVLGFVDPQTREAGSCLMGLLDGPQDTLPYGATAIEANTPRRRRRARPSSSASIPSRPGAARCGGCGTSAMATAAHPGRGHRPGRRRRAGRHSALVRGRRSAASRSASCRRSTPTARVTWTIRTTSIRDGTGTLWTARHAINALMTALRFGHDAGRSRPAGIHRHMGRAACPSIRRSPPSSACAGI